MSSLQLIAPGGNLDLPCGGCGNCGLCEDDAAEAVGIDMEILATQLPDDAPDGIGPYLAVLDAFLAEQRAWLAARGVILPGDCQATEPTPVEALYDSRDFGEPIDSPAVQSPAVELPEAEVLMARQGGGHGFGPDFEGGY